MLRNKTDTDKRAKLTARDIALMGMMTAIIEASKMALGFLPNIELTSFWLIIFTLYFGRKIIPVIPAFILIEGALYGFGLWWVMYLYAWPLLVLLTRIFRRHDNILLWAIISGAFGLSFGALCSIPYFFIGAAKGGVSAGLHTAFAWWIAGIPWDLTHAAGNFALMLILYLPVQSVMKRIGYEKSR